MENLTENNITNIKTHRKPVEKLEHRPYWFVEKGDVVGMKTSMTLTKYFMNEKVRRCKPMQFHATKNGPHYAHFLV